MKSEQLIRSLLKQGESKQLDFKKVVRKQDIGKTICSFLNTKGGQILIGVKGNEIIGIKDTEKRKSELENFLVPAIAPNAPISITIETYKDLKVFLIKVWRGSRFPYTFESSIYYRNQGTTAKATPNQISELIEKRKTTETLWERQDALDVELNDLDELVIRDTLKDLQKSGRGKSFSEDEISEFLTYYGLYQNGNLTNAAVILFAKEPARFLPQARVRLTVFKNSKAGDDFLYDKVFEGNLLRNVDDITQFFDVNIGISSHFKNTSWKRIDKGFPRLALREGLLNALMHRDYSNVSGTAIVAFYPDHLEITNYGALPSEIKPSDLKKNHLSLPRNPDIAHICFLRKWIEKIGRGTIKIINDCVDKGYPEPKWKSKSGVTTLIFPEVTVTAKTDDAVNDAVNDTVSDAVSDTVSNIVKNALIDTVKAILVDYRGVSIKEIMIETGKSNATVKRYLQILKNIDLVVFKGAAKTGRYFMTKAAMNKINKNK